MTMNKKRISETAFTILMMTAATALSFGFFYLGNKNVANIAIVYTLALILTALYTSGYLFGIIASLFCVIAVNYFFSYPYFRINFSLSGYPVTFIGMLAISLITSATTTTLKRQRQAIAEREKALAEADKEKLRANLLRAVSHDLRTPLTSIIGSSSSYLENYADLSEEERTELVGNIKEDSQWLLNMVENLLTVTRISEGRASVNKSLEPVEEVMSEAVFRLKKRIPDANIRVLLPEEFIMIPMDAMLIEQVLINLLENAVFHAGSSEPVECSVQIAKRDVTFLVTDQGVGIPEDKLTAIFDGTGHTENSVADGHKGMGIGLSICKTIVTAHGGTIGARNHGHGAQFYFTLPRSSES